MLYKNNLFLVVIFCALYSKDTVSSAQSTVPSTFEIAYQQAFVDLYNKTKLSSADQDQILGFYQRASFDALLFHQNRESQIEYSLTLDRPDLLSLKASDFIKKAHEIRKRFVRQKNQSYGKTPLYVREITALHGIWSQVKSLKN